VSLAKQLDLQMKKRGYDDSLMIFIWCAAKVNLDYKTIEIDRYVADFLNTRYPDKHKDISKETVGRVRRENQEHIDTVLKGDTSNFLEYSSWFTE